MATNLISGPNKEDIALMRKLRDEGMTVDEIVKITGRSITMVRKWCDKALTNAEISEYHKNWASLATLLPDPPN